MIKPEESPTTCPKCGMVVPPGINHCSNCGAHLHFGPMYGTRSNSMGKIVWTVVGVVIALICGFFGYCVYQVSNSGGLYGHRPYPSNAPSPPQKHQAPAKSSIQKDLDDANGN
jgi:hypothetical protein